MGSVVKKVARFLKYGQLTAMKGLQKLAPSEDAEKVIQQAFTQKMADMRGMPMKISQILSMSQNSERAADNSQAVSTIEPLDVDIIEQSISLKNRELFDSIAKISTEGLPASLGQVHQIEMDNGNTFALKVQYPGIKETIDADGNLMGMLTGAFSSFKKGFSLSEYEQFIINELQEELDYTREIVHQRKIYNAFLLSPNIVIPMPCEGLSDDSHIVMSWESSLSQDEFLKRATNEEKVTALSLIHEFYMRSIFEIGCIHADPNPGNFGFRLDATGVKVVVYDFGSVIQLTEKQRVILLKIVDSVHNSSGDLLSLFGALGFDTDSLAPVKNQLLAFTDLVLEPLLSQGRYNLKTWNRKERAEEILGKYRWTFMSAAPATFLPLIRALTGVYYYARLFDCGMYVYPMIKKQLQMHREHIDLCEVPKVSEGEVTTMARSLQVRVYKDGKLTLELALPRRAVDNLESFMDGDVLEKIKEKNISIPHYIQMARASGYAPMELLDITFKNKRMLLFLE